MRVLIIAIALAFISALNLSAQKALKIGYTSVELVVTLMPEYKTIRGQLQTHQEQLGRSLEIKKGYLQTKFTEYQEKSKTMKPEERAEEEKALQKLQEEIQKAAEDAEANLLKKREELLGPVLEKLQKAIDEIYTAEGYDYIFNSSSEGTQIIIKGPEQDNITLKLLGKLGVTPSQEIIDMIKGVKKPALVPSGGQK